MAQAFSSRSLLSGCFLALVLLSYSCNNENQEGEQHTTEQTADHQETKPKLNYTDANHLRQGRWETYVDDRLWQEEFYIDGQKDGTCFEYLPNEEVKATDYSHGIQTGFAIRYKKGEDVATEAAYWQMGLQHWSVNPAELVSQMIPKSGFQVLVPSANLKVSYVSGELLYEGKVVQKENEQGKPVGLHKLHYKKGGIKAEIDYDAMELRTFAPDGTLQNTTSLLEWQAKLEQSTKEP